MSLPEALTQPTAIPQASVSFDDMEPNTAQISVTGAYNSADDAEVRFEPKPSGLIAPHQVAENSDSITPHLTSPPAAMTAP